ncbi:MAG: porin, partial [Archangiaceae bacterium]|nr:porin [Archangiaceae bacterium]
MRRTLSLVVCLVASLAAAQGTSEYGSGLRWNLNPEGDRFIRAITWAQVWTRAIENNPGTTVDGVSSPWTTDVGLRRVRLLLYGQVFPRVLILTHLGINNQTFNNARKPGFFV